ncbi:MAG: hypothetical protein WA634_12175 [Silvibacterium sp.]
MSEENTFSRIILIFIAAVAIAVAIVGGYVWANWVPTPYSGQILSVNYYSIHNDLSQPTTTEGVGGQNEVYDEILVFANVRVRNVSKEPLYLSDMWAVANLPGEDDNSSAVATSDFQKVFIAYADTSQYQKPPLLRDITLQPGQQVDGMMIFNYQMNQAKWDSRTGLDINIQFIHKKPLVLHVAK